MENRYPGGAAGRCLIVLLLSLTLTGLGLPARAEVPGIPSARNYCNVPPLAGSGIKPNLLLMIDNSASMYDPAYTNTSTEPPTYCLDDTYRDTASYLGYFEPDLFYRYDFAGARFQAVAGPAGIPGSERCGTARNGYLCVNSVPDVSALGFSYQRVDNFLARGNFLNWLVMSKLDLEKRALTGGKYDPATGLLSAETRGCQGKRFVKMIDNLPVTFAVRGPIPSEAEYSYQSGRGGLSRIEVYANPYNRDACLSAIAAWRDAAGVGALRQAALGCLGDQFDANDVPTKGKVYTEIMTDCYSYLATGSLAPDPNLVTDCQERIEWIYGGNPSDIVRNTGDDVCGRGVFHHLTSYQGIDSSFGYLGGCYDLMRGFTFSAGCLYRQTLDYCKDLAHPWLTDPSVTANMTGTTLNVPGFILDAGISNLGEVSATLVARIPAAAPPTGLVQKYGGQINFGAMVFNDNGSGSECGDESSPIPCVKHCQYDPAPRRECAQASDCLVGGRDACREDPHLDGGRVISYLNHSPLGDHSPGSGLVAAIDAVNANSWTPWAEAFYEAIGYFANRTELRLQGADFDESWPPSQYSCQKNNILMVTDGMSTADRARAVNSYLADAQRSFGGAGGLPVSQTTQNSDQPDSGLPFQGSYNLDDLAWIANHTNINDPSRPIQNNRDFITSYVVYTGLPCGAASSSAYLEDGSCSTSDEGVPEKMMQLVAAKGGGRFLSVQRPADLESALASVFQLIGTGSNSGTDASIVSSGDANGALYLQEQFYPLKSFDGGASSASWLGELQALWYYLDPLLGSSGGASTIREDTGGLSSLDLKRDRVVRFSFDPAAKETRATLSLDADGDGSADAVQPAGYPRAVRVEALESLWRAGLKLWSRDPAGRTIYTQTDGSTLTLLDPDSPDQRALLQAQTPVEAAAIVSYVRGSDSDGTRSRSVARSAGGERRVWKLGDIVSSTPALQTANGLASYGLTPPRGYADRSYRAFLKGGAYASRGTVYLGANDGMLHAFRLGSLKLTPQPGWPSGQKAALAGADLGEEEWAFVPKNALPYLRYLKEPDCPHLYFVDGSPALVDASLGDPARCSRAGYWNCPKETETGSNWRTVLIGGMGQGGATRGPSESCSEGGGGTCVKSPRADGGFSAYFALDVTGQRADGTGTPPRLIWEFSPPGLGFATSGTAILKVNALEEGSSGLPDPARNGRWFAVFASGPTGSIDRDLCQLQGTSDQNLKLFVVDLNPAGRLVEGVNYWVIDTGIANAFGGSLSGGGIDADRWDPNSRGFYQDDALYLGYTRKAGDGSWTGGVLRLLTREQLDPAKWVVSRVIDGIGPVTGSIAKLQDRKDNKLWLYFGTGRYFYNRDDLTAGRALFGVQEPCYRPDNTLTPKDGTLCSAAPLRLADLYDATSAPVPAGSDTKGWWIGLDPASDGYGSERCTANPSALTAGVVYFPSFKPASDPCRQGASYLWGVRYDNAGGAPRSGRAVLPLSDASTAELPLSGWGDRGGRRSEALSGRAGNAKLISNSGLKPLKKIIHIQER